MSEILDPDSKKNVLPARSSLQHHALRPQQDSLSTTQLYHEPVIVGSRSLVELAQKVQDKLLRTRVTNEKTSFSAVISFESESQTRISDVDRLATFDWNTSERTRQITLSWDFHCQIDGVHESEQYTLSVRVSETMNPAQLVQAMFSRNPDEADRIEIDMACVVCFVRYHDAYLARELLQVVSDWHRALRKPAPVFDIARKAVEHRRYIDYFLRVSFELIIPLGGIGLFWHWAQARVDESITVDLLATFGVWFFSFVLFLGLARQLAKSMYRAIDRRLLGLLRTPILELTNGDQNRMTEAMAKKQNHLMKLAAKLAGALIFDAFSAYVLYKGASFF